MMVVPNSSTFLPGLDTPGSAFSHSQSLPGNLVKFSKFAFLLPALPAKKNNGRKGGSGPKGAVWWSRNSCMGHGTIDFPIVYSSTSKIHEYQVLKAHPSKGPFAARFYTTKQKVYRSHR